MPRVKPDNLAAQLESFVARFDPPVAALATASLERMRTLAPGALELVYDAYSALSVGFSATERTSDHFLHVAVYPRHVNIGFPHGVSLDDPDGLLVGTGRATRHVRIDEAAQLAAPALGRLVRAAMSAAGFRAGKPPGPIFIKRIYEKQLARSARG